MPKIDKDAIKPGMLLTGGGYAASSRALPRDLDSAEADPLAVLKKDTEFLRDLAKRMALACQQAEALAATLKRRRSQ